MTKRSRRNPLSSARNDAGGGEPDRRHATTKADHAARRLWHRKSGAGYRLFLSYYGAQPAGVVVSAAEDADLAGRGRGREATADVANNGAPLPPTSRGGASRGMSRAAKKRRRHKEKSGTGCDAAGARPPEASDSRRDGDGAPSCSASSPPPEASHPLLEAFRSQNGHRHLTGFVLALSRPLPLTLRFREHEQSSSCVAAFKQLLAQDHADLLAPVAYDPTRSIYQATPTSGLCKANLGKLCPELKARIVAGSADGALARQELGSMLPVLGLRAVGAIGGGARVLDLCASPGSKTLQALEIVGDRGRVIANDVHAGRLDALRAAVARSRLPARLAARVTYTNFDASTFPGPRSGTLFDAILCDVPCGGDGTVRKDGHVLPNWTPRTGRALHGLQARILRRALALVKVGGAVCYSTCSLDPIEDEAVVAAALRSLSRDEDEEEGDADADADAAKAFELLEWPRQLLPGFVRRPGVVRWKVAFDARDDDVGEDEDDGGRLSFFDDRESARAAGHADAAASLWPDATRNARLRLKRCTRLFPQDQDTGGFFLALIKRTK